MLFGHFCRAAAPSPDWMALLAFRFARAPDHNCSPVAYGGGQGWGVEAFGCRSLYPCPSGATEHMVSLAYLRDPRLVVGPIFALRRFVGDLAGRCLAGRLERYCSEAGLTLLPKTIRQGRRRGVPRDRQQHGASERPEDEDGEVEAGETSAPTRSSS